ncbi:MAG: transcriptional repressor, partial [Pseudomonadota bacterium]
SALAQKSGQRLTPIRRKVLALLVSAGGPAKAYDLMRQLDGEGAAKPPTVYRALDFLQALGLVHKIESLNAYVACGHMHHRHSAVFLICDACGSAEELHAERTSQALENDTKSVAFALERAVIEARGTCRNCAT